MVSFIKIQVLQLEDSYINQTIYGSNKNCKDDEYVYRVEISTLSFLQTE